MRIGLVRCVKLPEPDPDEQLLLDAVRATGVDAQIVSWDEESFDASSFDAVVIRATWNYYTQPDRFRDWLCKTAEQTMLLNPLESVLGNLHKSYLHELEAAGVPVIPTMFAERQSTVDLASVIKSQQWESFVIKPAISAASFLTKRFDRDSMQEGQAFLETMLHNRDAMIQKYMTSVKTHGERALVWIDGKLTHTIRKVPRFVGEEEAVSEAMMPSDDERQFAQHVLSCIDYEKLLYARVDVMPNEAGELCLSELELIEPSLFLAQHPPALERLASAIAEQKNGPQGPQGQTLNAKAGLKLRDCDGSR